MNHLPFTPALAVMALLASPASAATLTDLRIEWTMTPGASQYVWETETGTFTLRPTEDWFVIDYTRERYVPGYRAAAWWHVLDDQGRELDKGDIVDMGGCPVHGGLARREDRAQPWLACGTGTAVMTPPYDNPAPVALPASLWMLALGVATVWRMK